MLRIVIKLAHTSPMRLSLSAFIIVMITFIPCTKAVALGWSGNQLDGQPCIGLDQGYGPFDHVLASTNKDIGEKTRLWEVDGIHYHKGLKLLKSKGVKNSTIRRIASHYDYTLRAFPNHKDALYSVINLELTRLRLNKKYNKDIQRLRTPPECYLIRASIFRPKQPYIYLLFAIYLHKLEIYNRATEYYEKALSFNQNYAEAHYNYGLLLFELKKYKIAMNHASRAYQLNYPLPGLKEKLVSVGHWKETE